MIKVVNLKAPRVNRNHRDVENSFPFVQPVVYPSINSTSL